MGSIRSSHNKQVLQPRSKNYGYNWRKKRKLSVGQQMPYPNIIYQAQITNNTNDEHKKSLGAVETSFKERYSNHTRDFKHKKCMKSTELSKYI